MTDLVDASALHRAVEQLAHAVDSLSAQAGNSLARTDSSRLLGLHQLSLRTRRPDWAPVVMHRAPPLPTASFSLDLV